ncbi:MAG: DeoR/GlpR transcriptional regulator [Clostridia bacterium]|nr:DeoR/GlpR transcriptional regulator [Clostridia bacterium]
MYQQVRQDAIMDILRKEGYVTVAYLTRQLHYSTATINRDLNALSRQGLVRRSYGGAELADPHSVKLPFRYHKMKTEKRLIGQAAAALIQPGDTVFIDGTTTTQSMAPHLTDIEGLTVITNNLALVEFLSGEGVDVLCLGGRIAEPPSMVCDAETVRQASGYRADKLFFSTGGFTADGVIGCGIRSPYRLLHKAMAAGATQRFFLADHDKLDAATEVRLFDFGQVEGIISDYRFPEETVARFPQTQFICVK